MQVPFFVFHHYCLALYVKTSFSSHGMMCSAWPALSIKCASKHVAECVTDSLDMLV